MESIIHVGSLSLAHNTTCVLVSKNAVANTVYDATCSGVVMVVNAASSKRTICNSFRVNDLK